MTHIASHHTETLEHAKRDGEAKAIRIGRYKGTLTDPLSARYSPWTGNVSMHHGETEDGTPVTVYRKPGVPAVYSED